MLPSLGVGPFGLHDGSALRDSFLAHGIYVINGFIANVDCHSDGFVLLSPPTPFPLLSWLDSVGYFLLPLLGALSSCPCWVSGFLLGQLRTGHWQGYLGKTEVEGESGIRNLGKTFSPYPRICFLFRCLVLGFAEVAKPML